MAPPIGRSWVHLAAGRLDAAAETAEQALALETEATLLAPLARSALAGVAAMRGDLPGAARQMSHVRDAPWPRSAFGTEPGRWVEARIRAGREDVVVGDLLAELADEIATNRALLLEEPGAAAWLTRTALAAGDRACAESVAAIVEQLRAQNPEFPAIVAVAAHVLGILERDVASLRRAGRDLAHPWARASAAEDAGVVLADTGDEAEAIGLFEQALEGYADMGADLDATRVRARLRRLGVRRQRASRAERPVTGWESLTETEGRIAVLVAEGLTNRRVAEQMFLSPHTVDFHLRHVYRKLFISSRIELARVALEADVLV
jgi:DNA-binding CsgD family transcriptional regulator